MICYLRHFTYKELISKLEDMPSSSFVGLPKSLLESKDKFAFLLPGGCERETKNNLEI
jgi:beta-1,4-mannosyl-glycoprotein beta-1,4-N-acetylglucosaminyltransferase